MNDFFRPPRGLGPETPNGGDGKEGANDNAASLCRRFGAMIAVGQAWIESNLASGQMRPFAASKRVHVSKATILRGRGVLRGVKASGHAVVTRQKHVLNSAK